MCLVIYSNIVATLFIVMGNVFLVAFGNHQSKGIHNMYLHQFKKQFTRH